MAASPKPRNSSVVTTTDGRARPSITSTSRARKIGATGFTTAPMRSHATTITGK